MESERIPGRTSYHQRQDTAKIVPGFNFSSSIMSETNSDISLQQTHQPNPILEPLLHALDPISLILNHNSYSHHPFPLRLTSADSFIMERGPNYSAYAELRETRLRMKYMGQEQEKEETFEVEAPKFATPPRKNVSVQGGLACGRKGSSLVVAQSVPDFSAALRKENRKPLNMNTLPSMMEMTPPPSKSGFSKDNGVVSNSRGSKSESAGEKKKKGGGGGGVLMGRKTYASFDELKCLSSATAIAINGESRRGRNGRMMGKTDSGLRKF